MQIATDQVVKLIQKDPDIMESLEFCVSVIEWFAIQLN